MKQINIFDSLIRAFSYDKMQEIYNISRATLAERVKKEHTQISITIGSYCNDLRHISEKKLFIAKNRLYMKDKFKHIIDYFSQLQSYFRSRGI